MKTKKILFLICCIIATSLNAKKNHGLLFNIGTIVIGNYELNYEYKLNKKTTISTLFHYYESRKVPVRIFSYGYQLGMGVAPKFHIFGNAFKNSIYLAPTFKVGYLVHPKYKDIKKREEGLLFRTGAVFGYAHTFKFGFSIDMNAGLEHYHNIIFTKPPTARQGGRSTKSQVRPVLSFAVGYAF